MRSGYHVYRKGESGMIYIIEDDENIRNLVQVALNGSGYG